MVLPFITFLTCNILQILRNCKVSRIVPLIADTSKNDRSAILRARYLCFALSQHAWSLRDYRYLYIFSYGRCCEYALLILEYWADAPEIQRSADLYEDLIKCCVADAMSEVGLTSMFPGLITLLKYFYVLKPKTCLNLCYFLHVMPYCKYRFVQLQEVAIGCS